ncbi:MAG: hypothetical protein IPM69_05700 [Ignavibacteria bacterium]|nr:hypothetical protein [Ignavibacteria bacterium]
MIHYRFRYSDREYSSVEVQWYGDQQARQEHQSKRTQDGNYTIETTSPTGCKVTSNVFGYTKPSSAVLTVAISPKTISGAAGETVKVPIVITSSKNLTQATASSFSAELAVEPTLLIPATGTSTIDNLNRRIITINGTRKDGNDTLAIVELKAGLGAMEVSPIVLKIIDIYERQGSGDDGGWRIQTNGNLYRRWNTVIQIWKCIVDRHDRT